MSEDRFSQFYGRATIDSLSVPPDTESDASEQKAIVAPYIPIYHPPGSRENERLDTPKSIIPENCPQCKENDYHVLYTSPLGFRCIRCGCEWQEEEVGDDGKTRQNRVIHSTGKEEIPEDWITSCPKCDKKSYFVVRQGDKVKFICKDCKHVWETKAVKPREIIFLLAPEDNENPEEYFGTLYGKDFKIMPMTRELLRSSVVMLQKNMPTKIEISDMTTGKVSVLDKEGGAKEAYVVMVRTESSQEVDGTLVRE